MQSKCPFSMIQAAGSASCSLAQQVVRRGGSEFDCTREDALGECVGMLQHMTAVALPALGHEDDLTLTPKSVYERVMVGGLQGLRMEADAADVGTDTSNIHAVVVAAIGRHGEARAVPDSSFVPAIEECRIKRRRGREE